jgi:DNA-binding NarL/FixJ family response regulator
MPIRLLIVDDDARFRALARTLLGRLGYPIVAEAVDGAQALATARRVRLDAALVDVQLPDIDGLALARRLQKSDGSLRVLLTSTDPTLATPAALAQSGAVAFVPKDGLATTNLAPLLGD